MRINQKDLESVVNRINTATGNKLEPYTTTKPGKFFSNAGVYLIDWAYGGCKLNQIVKGGGVKSITSGFVTKRELYYLMHTFLSGLEAK